MARAVGVDSDDEDVTAACLEYRAENVYPYLADQGMTVTTFAGPQADRTLVQPEIQQATVGFISGSGHGFPNRFTGQRRLSILELGQYNPPEVAGKIIHLLSCETAGLLGADLVAKGCLAFFGYDENFFFPLNKPEVFLDCDSVIDQRLADGLTAEEAHDEAIAAFDRRILQLLKAGNTFLAAALERNRDHLCSPSVDRKWGDPHARLAGL